MVGDKPTRMPEIAKRNEKLEPREPNCLGVRSRSRMIGTAARPTTVLSAKLMSMNENRRAVMPHAPFGVRSSLTASPRAFPRTTECPGHHGPSHPADLVGERNGGNIGRSPQYEACATRSTKPAMTPLRSIGAKFLS
jgi:hypothetical protein